MKVLFYIIMCSVIGASCGWLDEQQPLSENDPLVIAAAQKRLEQYKRVKIKNCRAALLDRAESKVDSLMTEIIAEFVKDTIYFPQIPEKPAFPNKLEEDTSLKARPIIDSLAVNFSRDTLSQIKEQ